MYSLILNEMINENSMTHVLKVFSFMNVLMDSIFSFS